MIRIPDSPSCETPSSSSFVGFRLYAFVLGGWAKGYSVPLVDQSGNDRSEFGLIATVYYTDGTNQAFTAHFNPCVDIWQFTSTAIVARSAYSSIKVSMAYDYNCNTAWFDGIQLFKEQYGTSYTYDSNGNVTSVKDLRKQTTAYEYSNNNLTKATLPAGGKLTYTYDNYHNVKTATTDTGAVYTFAYDTYGNNTSVSIGSGTSKITSSATYTSDGNRLATTEDAAGKVTTYSYNANTNVLEWVKAPNDTDATKTTYTYDAMYRMASAVKDPSSGGLNLSANYTYTNDYLTGVQTPSTQYSFTYGAFGQRTSVKIGSRSLAAYTYTGQNHLLSTLDYGNGDRVNYTYDSKSRVTKQTYEDSTYTSFLYDNCGQLASITDSKTGLTTKYLDDLTGRSAGYLEQSSQYSNAAQYGYDVNNNVTQRFNTILGTVYKTYYTYDSENRIKLVDDGGVYKDYTYDSYGRASRQVSRFGNTAVLTNDFTYRSPSSTATTGQIAGYSMTASGYSKSLSYTYDNNGNILTVSDGTNTTSYVYDKANQLLRENNQAAGKTWTYAYDNAGNILSKTEYAYTTGTLGTALSTKNYTYSDQTWGDLLTSYNGTAITYDTIGNPLNDGTRTYTWERGRRLASLTAGGSTWSQTYNNDGLRIGRIELSQFMAQQENILGYYLKWNTRAVYDKALQAITYAYTAWMHPRKEDSPLVYFGSDGAVDSYCCNRDVFCGNYRDERNPVEIETGHLSNTNLQGGEPCGALHSHIALAPGEERELHYYLGVTKGALADYDRAVAEKSRPDRPAERGCRP